MSNSIEIIKKTPLRQVKTVQHLLWNDQAREQLAAVAAKHMNPERMMRVVANAIRTTPKLQECDPMSFLGALMHCAAMGLEPNTPLGHAYLIPFENKRKGNVEVQTIIGYKGYLDLARRSGQVKSIHADVVYDDDELFSHEYGSDQHLRHKPGPREGRKIGAYCHVKLNLGPDVTAEGHVYLNAKQILRIRDQFSQGWKTAVRYNKTDESPWIVHEDAMWAKTAVRAMSNRGELPMSIEFMSAVEQDERRMDYRAFAMDPVSGLAPSEDGDFIEGEAADAKAKVEAEAEKQRLSRHELQKQHRAAEAAAKAKPATSSPDAQPAAKEQEAHDPETGELPLDQAEDARAETAIDPYSNPFAKTFLQDVGDMGWDQAMGFHEQEVDLIRDRNPALYAAICREAVTLDPTAKIG